MRYSGIHVSVMSAFIQQEGSRDRRCPRSLRASWPDILSSKQKRICLRIRWSSSPDFHMHAVVLKHTCTYTTRMCAHAHTLRVETVFTKRCDAQRGDRIENPVTWRTSSSGKPILRACRNRENKGGVRGRKQNSPGPVSELRMLCVPAGLWRFLGYNALVSTLAG